MGAFDNTIGAGYIGALTTAVLFGVTCIQSLTFSQRCERDKPFIKYMVLGLFVTDTAHMIFVSHTIYWYTITNFTNADALRLVPWSIMCGVLADNISDMVIRSFFARSVWHLSRHNRPLAYILSVLVFLTFVDGIGFGIKGFTVHNFAEFAAISWLMYSGFAIALVCDFLIAGSLCYYLFTSRTGFKGTDSLINILSTYAINTGLVTSIFCALCFITYAAMPDNYIFLAFYFPLSKLYVNALLATLNARGRLREKSAASSFTLSKRTALSSMKTTPPHSAGLDSDQSDSVFMSVHIQTVVTSDDMTDTETGSSPNIELKHVGLTGEQV